MSVSRWPRPLYLQILVGLPSRREQVFSWFHSKSLRPSLFSWTYKPADKLKRQGNRGGGLLIRKVNWSLAK